jgi:hypothetical protein
MNVESELLAYLEQCTEINSNNEKQIAIKQRNIDLTACYYGFRESKWPTYDEVAESYAIGTRERVRQIINKTFRNHAQAASFPAVRSCATVLKKRDYWTEESYQNALAANNIEVDGGNIQGLLDLMHDLSLASDYQAYTTDFREMTRSLLNQGMEIILMTQQRAHALRRALKLASDRPGLVGIANLKLLADEEKWSSEFYRAICDSVTLSPRAWSWQDGDNFWYTFEHRQTTLRTYSEKVFSVINVTTAEHLAEIYENALHARTVGTSLPPRKVIETYLRESLLFKQEGELIQFTGKLIELSDIEWSIVGFFKKKGQATYVELRDYLLAKNFSKPLIDKQLTHSCLVHVDRSLGRKQHVYSLVRQFDPATKPTVTPSLYATYFERLRRLYEEETDESCESTRRKEHSILQDWLFKGKVTECCALCGEKFNVNALVTAHKKKRAHCTTAERLDPYIVMPVCAFGCDFLYERGYIYVEAGKVRVNTAKRSNTAEYQRALMLKGKIVSKAWLHGKPGYFPKPALLT